MAEARREHAGKRRHKARRRRHRSRPSVLKRLLQPVWIEIRTMWRTPLYRWSLSALASLTLLFWLLGVVLPSSSSYPPATNVEGQPTR